MKSHRQLEREKRARCEADAKAAPDLRGKIAALESSIAGLEQVTSAAVAALTAERDAALARAELAEAALAAHNDEKKPKSKRGDG